MTNGMALLPCPFCGEKPEAQHFNISPNLPGRIICSCGAEMRQCRSKTCEELASAWNTRSESAGYCKSKREHGGGCVWEMD